MHYPPKGAISKLVGSLKGVSARRLRQEFPDHSRRYLWGARFWSPSYFAASCGGAPLSILKEYIENQKATGVALRAISRRELRRFAHTVLGCDSSRG